MGKSELKLKLHNLVDRINDEMILLNFYNAFSSIDADFPIFFILDETRYPTEPSKLIANNFCASTANSIGN